MKLRGAKSVVVCDIDGTIADLTHRLHYIKNKPKDWNKFFDQCQFDAPFGDICYLLDIFKGAGKTIIYVSGRSSVVEKATKEWLYKFNLPAGRLYMRSEGDYRADYIIKEEIIDRIELTPEEVLCVLDDRNQVVNMWRRRGFRVLQVAEGEF
jgi:hypothetical protein